VLYIHVTQFISYIRHTYMYILDVDMNILTICIYIYIYIYIGSDVYLDRRRTPARGGSSLWHVWIWRRGKRTPLEKTPTPVRGLVKKPFSAEIKKISKVSSKGI